MIELYIRNFRFFIAASFLLVAIDVILINSLAVAVSDLPLVSTGDFLVIYIYLISLIPLGAFGAFISHRSYLLNKNYHFLDFFDRSCWPSIAFWKIVFLLTFFMMAFSTLAQFALKFLFFDDLFNGYLGLLLSTGTFLLTLLISYTLAIVLFGLSLPAASIGKDSRLKTSFLLVKGQRFSLCLNLILAFILSYIVASFFSHGVDTVILFTNPSSQLLIKTDTYNIIDLIALYLHTLISFFYTTAIVSVLSKHYLKVTEIDEDSQKSDNLDN